MKDDNNWLRVLKKFGKKLDLPN